ncbi:hypothetical protein SBOR_4243 [Sclerotinia borealis F-4128]|uniref:Transmembrane protein n=1 Tax=Sclerotinia borealis (strain F-4128) TaxID=1432307 RepID=W9CF77_SCLBF|nr:hypothetical protein SBOR_4243 [Sclerotinia borealis F-4128]
MSTLSSILPILLLMLPITMATVESDFPKSPRSNFDQEQQDFESNANSALTIHIIISVVVLVVFILVIIILATAARRRRQSRKPLAGNMYDRPGVRITTAAPPYRVGDDVDLPAYSYEPVRGETVVAQSSSTVAQPAPAHVSKDVV